MTELLVWYDRGCPLCRREIAFMRRLDAHRKIDFVDVSEPDVDCPLDRDVLLRRFHAREDGRIVSGAEAFAAMWRAIPLLRPLGLLARNPIALACLERCYRAFLLIRPKLRSALRSRERLKDAER